MKHFNKYLLLLWLILPGCKKFLDAKPERSLTTINTLTDLQSLLDRSDYVNTNTVSSDLVSCDDYYLTNTDFLALDFVQARNMYTWEPSDLYYPYTDLANDWTNVYKSVYLANIVLDHIGKIERSSQNSRTWDDLKGQAHFLRAYNFYKAITIWAPAYDASTSQGDLGIPLRLNSNFNETSVRSNIAAGYDQIFNDLRSSLPLLETTPKHVYRGSKAAAYALLSEVSLAMRNYTQARLYADSCLQINSKLVDYNKINGTPTYPMTRFNDEVIYDTAVGGSGSIPTTRSRARIDSNLIKMYHVDDLRTTLFFSAGTDGSKLFRGSYEGSSSRFNGLATDMTLLTRAECAARAGETAVALSDLNRLLQNRFKTGTFTPVNASSAGEALAKILTERRKELVMRGSRWIDIKRLNKDGSGITLKRDINGKVFTLPPNDLRYALAIPEDVIALSGMPQNPR
ncbi:RagB/SusD family nutrient uptake outer membrane protein [Mucilaginibacter hurinus]|uniref:RagB/SusD family nutrient uptake outer membrane protein n=1 Tax=Mucilaginibacter hurinus TaxID=2201324 RepID=A0A367GMJ7_9SPHI|nr:RagB/SusD family nutrient uptake outer membrane protein [Mucilaginibacter hurinus]RCH54679.1 RagB/SusD family nutrient uptake outer membrane protein [Mucilaginibacter hurinus]